MKEFITILILLMPLGASMARADDQTARENLDKASRYLSKDPSRSVYFARTALEEATVTKSQSLMAEAQAMIANSGNANACTGQQGAKPRSVWRRPLRPPLILPRKMS